jgi:hypothetical protein
MLFKGIPMQTDPRCCSWDLKEFDKNLPTLQEVKDLLFNKLYINLAPHTGLKQGAKFAKKIKVRSNQFCATLIGMKA